MFSSSRILYDNEKVINNAAIFCNELNCLTAFGKSSWHPNFSVNRCDGEYDFLSEAVDAPSV